MSDTKAVHLNADELKVFMNKIIKTNVKLQAAGNFPVTIEVEGDSGIGKTSIIKQVAEDMNLEFVKVNLAQLDELGDIIGYPTRQFEMAKNKAQVGKPEEWVRVWADEALLQDYKAQGYTPTGKDKMAYSLPEWVPTHENGCLILFDDWNRAQQRFIQACMEILDRQEYISWKMPKNCTIVLSANPDNGDYQVQSQDNAQKTRYISTYLKFDIDCWARWAEKAGVDTRCINFLLMNPEVVTTKTNARSVVQFFNGISNVPVFENELAFIQMVGEGSVGTEFAHMFAMFINNQLDKLIDPETMLSGHTEEQIVKLMKQTTGVADKYRQDIAGVLATRFTNYINVYAEDNAIDEKIIKRLTTFTTGEVFPDDLKYFIVRDVIGVNKAKFQKLCHIPEIVKRLTK